MYNPLSVVMTIYNIAPTVVSFINKIFFGKYLYSLKNLFKLRHFSISLNNLNINKKYFRRKNHKNIDSQYSNKFYWSNFSFFS